MLLGFVLSTLAMASNDGKYIFDERPENSPAIPTVTTTTHLNRPEKTLYASSESACFGVTGRVDGSDETSCSCRSTSMLFVMTT